jgi:tRNA(Ile)-lysidine synthase
MAARDLRYNWFKELLREHSLDSVVVGHHQNDDVETFLINLLRGSGIRGMLAMSAKNNNIVRPLLSVNREEIEEYLHEIKQDFREDSSNKSVKYLRNRIRLQVMPTLKDINPKINQTISDEIEILDAVFQIFQQQIDFQKQKLLSTENGVLKIRISDLVKLKPLNVYLYEFLKPFGFTEIKKLISTLSSQSGKQFFSSSHQLVIDREFVFIEELTKSSEEYIISENQVMINTPITVSFDLSKNTEITKYQKKVKLDYSKLEFPLILRKWKKGDKFIPLGMRQFKKLSNFFIDEKYSILDKQKQWLLCSANNIVWVVGVRIDDRFKIDKNTKKVYIAELLNKD